MKTRSHFILTCALLVTAAGIIVAPSAHAAQHELLAANSSAQDGGKDNSAPSQNGAQAGSDETVQPKTAVVLRFAVESQPAAQELPGPSALSLQACPQVNAANASTTTAKPSKSLTVDPEVLNAISAEMQKRLEKRSFVLVDPNPSAIPVGSTVISGCITGAKSGNAGARLIGMNLGASRLSVHVIALSKTRDGWTSVDTFDIHVKGGDLLPPLGPAVLVLHAVRDPHQKLSNDATKLADQIVKKLDGDMKQQTSLAKAG